jgi:glucose-1-phosphate thymidylyltransferase
MSQSSKDYIGLVPAGGSASRLSPLPFSKELYPVGFDRIGNDTVLKPKVVSHFLLEGIRRAGVEKAYIILRPGKWDLPDYFKGGSMIDLSLGYLVTDLPFGVPYTLDQAYPFVKNDYVAFGFPDIIYSPQNAFSQLIKKQITTNADIVLGLFEATNCNKVDMVETDANGQIIDIRIKPQETNLHHTWLNAVWSPKFTEFLHVFVKDHKNDLMSLHSDLDVDAIQEVFIGEVIRSAGKHNLKTQTLVFNQGRYLDIGTPEDVVKAVTFKA